jgi:hypothetical protein
MSYIGNEPTSVAFLTDTFSGNGSTTAFTLSAAPATTSSILVAITGVLQDPSTYSVSGTTLTFSPAPPTGTSNISVRFLGIPASGVTTTAYRTVTEFTATSGQTTFSVPSYTVGFIDVYQNGVLLGSADYTATSGLTVVLAIGATVGDLVEVISFQVSSVLNAMPTTGGTFSGNVLFDSGDGIWNTSGNVGIGTTSPSQRLDVNGNIRASDGTQEILINGTLGSIEITRGVGNPFIDFKSDIAEDYDCRIQQVSDGLTFQTGGNGSQSIRMTIDSSGRVTTPSQPMFRAVKNNGQTMDGAGATDIKVEYNNPATNIGNCYSAANDRFTAPVAGMYHFSAFFMFQSIPTDYSYAFIRFLRNGSDALESEVMMPRPSGGLFGSPLVTMSVYLAANDYIEVWARQAGGSNNMTIRDSFGVFSGFLVG